METGSKMAARGRGGGVDSNLFGRGGGVCFSHVLFIIFIFFNFFNYTRGINNFKNK